MYEIQKLPLARTWVPIIVTCHAMNVIESNDINQTIFANSMKLITRIIVATTIVHVVVVGVVCASRLHMVFIMSMILMFGDFAMLA
jgi:hypothetical protein